MKKVQALSFLLLLLTLAVMAVNRLAVPLPDWTVRIDGVVMMLALVGVSYGTVRRSGER